LKKSEAFFHKRGMRYRGLLCKGRGKKKALRLCKAKGVALHPPFFPYKGKGEEEPLKGEEEPLHL
jgi:hypothetical protein